ncbi:histidine kinase dimerization/phospho-acceptor domain-containing protein, partial [Vibrio natriegens]
MSESIAAPLSQIPNMVDRVSTGDFNVSHEGFRLKEINETANAIIHMGSKLDTLTAALKEAKLEAENANMAKSQFISTVSHELRTPLNSILGMSYILLHSELNNEQKSSLMKIDK